MSDCVYHHHIYMVYRYTAPDVWYSNDDDNNEAYTCGGYATYTRGTRSLYRTLVVYRYTM